MLDSFISRRCPVKYCSEAGDLVIGRIIDRQGEHYRVDIGDRFDGLLQYYDFEGATKQTNDLIFTRVQRASVNCGAILTCKSAQNKKTWSSGEAEFGPLVGGNLLACPIALCQLLLNSQRSQALDKLGRHFKFEVTLGFNGKIWVKAKDCLTTILISNAILKAELPADEFDRLIQQIKHI